VHPVDEQPEPLEFDEPPHPKLPEPFSKELRAALGAELRGRPKARVDQFLIRADELVAGFCDFEDSELRRGATRIKRELRQLARHVATMRAALNRLSPEAHDSFDLLVWPGFEFPPDWDAIDRPLQKRPILESMASTAAPTTPRPPAAESSYYIYPAQVVLDQLARGINEALTTRNRGGARYRIGWYGLAYDVAVAMKRDLGEVPTPRTNGTFECLFEACLTVGLKKISNKRRVPSDLRPYVRAAIRSLKEIDASSINTVRK
jgi:hypothetical protein